MSDRKRASRMWLVFLLLVLVLVIWPNTSYGMFGWHWKWVPGLFGYPLPVPVPDSIQ